MNQKKIYEYEGAVLNLFGDIVCHHWTAETTAVSLKKARANLAYRYSKIYKSTPVSLPGKFTERSYV